MEETTKLKEKKMRLGHMFLMLAASLSACIYAPAFAGQVEEARLIKIGGIDQWITIRGNDARPVLLLLHGGPGDVQSPFVSTYAPYQKDFLLVQWDQRGSGRTFTASRATDITLARQVSDGIELSKWLHDRFPDHKLIVFGHSWGSVIATGMVQQRPELFAAYVGTGQVSTWADTVQFQFDFLKRMYKEKGAADALAALEAIGTPDPDNLGQYFGFSRPLRQYMNASDTAWFAGMQTLATANGETEATLKATSDGMSASGAALIRSIASTDLPTTATKFEVPYFVIQGRHDISAPTSLAEAYFAKVVAPEKRMVIIEDAGHFALATHQKQVIAALQTLSMP
jgi:pimeloyl-ACP methyl ester carboxylesterase